MTAEVITGSFCDHPEDEREQVTEPVPFEGEGPAEYESCTKCGTPFTVE